MRKVYLLLAVALLVVPASLSAREVARLTRYTGSQITGVSAKHMFNVELVKSDQTKAIVEIDTELEQYLKFNLNSDGTVEVGLDIPDAQRRRFERDNRNFWRDRTIRLVVYLPELQYMNLSDMTNLTTADAFTGGDVVIRINDMSKLKELNLTATSLDIKCDDMSSAKVICTVTTLNAIANDMSKIALEGSAREAKVHSNDMSGISGDDFITEKGEIHAHDMAKASLHVTQSLLLRSSDMGTASYKGDPASVDIRTPRRTEYRQASN